MKVKNKLKSRKGFTLMEMLIVIAIIAILVAISMPIFLGQLNRAKEATDAANERAAKAVAVAEYLTETKKDGTYNYDIETGKLVPQATVPATYGKCNTHTNQYIVVKIDAGTVEISWSSDTAGTSSAHDGAVTATN